MAASLYSTHFAQLPKILIVEDNARYAFELLRVFKHPHVDSQYQVDVATTTDEASVYVDRDCIDIYIVDLKLPAGSADSTAKSENGKRLVQLIAERTNAGIVILTNVQMREVSEELLKLGADDYLSKGLELKFVKAKIDALWRRVMMARPNTANKFVHTNRTFRVGPWLFVIGERDLRNDVDKVVRLSPTEHAFLRHLCTVEDHEITRSEFNINILGRRESEEDRRIDNLVYRIRGKLGEGVQLVSKRDGAYKLINVSEVRSLGA